MPLSSSRMFFRLLLRAATVRRGRTLTALLAMSVAATLATALLSLYSDIGEKLGGDFSKFGANVMVTAQPGAVMTSADLTRIETAAGTGGQVVPFAYAVAHLASGKPVIVAGTDFEKARTLNSFWSVTQWPRATGQALAGVHAAQVIASEEKKSLEFNGKAIEIVPVGELRTGGEEDSRIYLSLAEFTQWTGVGPSVVEVSVPGSADQVRATIARLKQTPELRQFDIQPVRQIVEAETRVLGKTRFILLLSTIAITFTVALCVLATLTASVLERRKDYAVMKALGSSQGAVSAIFLGESLSLAIVGAIAGFIAGCGLAMWIGRANFHAAVEPRTGVFPPVLAGCLAIALFSALVPLTLLQKTEPAAMLKGE